MNRYGGGKILYAEEEIILLILDCCQAHIKGKVVVKKFGDRIWISEIVW